MQCMVAVHGGAYDHVHSMYTACTQHVHKQATSIKIQTYTIKHKHLHKNNTHTHNKTPPHPPTHTLMVSARCFSNAMNWSAIPSCTSKRLVELHI